MRSIYTIVISILFILLPFSRGLIPTYTKVWSNVPLAHAQGNADAAGVFAVEEYVNSSWQFVASSTFPGQPYPNRYTTKSFTLSQATKRIRIINDGDVQSAHLDQVILDARTPVSAMNLSSHASLPIAKFADADYDVVGAQNRTIELSWKTKGTSLSITGVAENFKGVPYRWPEEGYLDYTVGSFKTYTFVEISVSSHPFAVRYAYVSADKKNLYVKVDWTSDNTLDIDKNGDWVELGVVTKDGLKTFLINGYGTEWGTSAFTYTDKVSWQHKVYTFTIPLNKIEAAYNKNIQFQIRYYGTDGSDGGASGGSDGGASGDSDGGAPGTSDGGAPGTSDGGAPGASDGGAPAGSTATDSTSGAGDLSTPPVPPAPSASIPAPTVSSPTLPSPPPSSPIVIVTPPSSPGVPPGAPPTPPVVPPAVPPVVLPAVPPVIPPAPPGGGSGVGGGGAGGGGGGGGAGGGSGGGAGVPNIVLGVLPHVGAQPLMLYLSQIPYTGLDLGPGGTILYWLALVLWALAASYLVLFGAMPLADRHVRIFASRVMAALSREQSAVVAPIPVVTKPPLPMPPVARNLPEASRPYSTYDGFKSFANNGALSVEDIVKSLSEKNVEPIYDNVEPIFDRVEPLYPAPTASAWVNENAGPIVGDTNEGNVPPHIRGFTAALIEGDRAAVFAALRTHVRGEGEPEKLIHSAVCLLDDAYRARIDGTTCDPSIARMTARLAPPTFEKLIAALATAIDSSYELSITGAKLALTRALMVLGA